MPEMTGGIVFLGDSITEYVNFDEYLPLYKIINKGIAGDTVSGVLRRLGEVISLEPRKLFLLIGVNDVCDGIETAPIVRSIRKMMERVQSRSPYTKIYLQAVFPVRLTDPRINADIRSLNISLKALASALHCTFIDLYSLLLGDDGELAEEYTVDGLHLNASAMAKWMSFIEPYLDE